MHIKNYIKDLRILPRFLLDILPGAIVDPNGYGFINLMLQHAHVPDKYKYMFFPENEGEVFIDCGMNVGLITDIARKMDMEVYGFEPNPSAIRLLKGKYKDDKLVHIYPYAVGNEEGEMDFYINPYRSFDQSASIVKGAAEMYGGEKIIKVPVKKLSDILLDEILPKHKHIHLLKIDIEGAEFGVINDIIDKELYKNIKYIVVETHERFFKDGKKMLKDLNDKIKKNNIQNIYLDWI